METIVTWKTKGYRSRHDWIQRRLGTPELCSNCGLSSLPEGKKRYFEWSNKSGEYLKDVSDWERLCVPCHRRSTYNNIPKKEFCSRGHTRSSDNLTRSGACKICKNNWNKEYFKRIKMELL